MTAVLTPQSTDDERDFMDMDLHGPGRSMSFRNLDETRATTIIRDTKSVGRYYVREVKAGKQFKKRVIVSRRGSLADL